MSVFHQELTDFTAGSDFPSKFKTSRHLSETSSKIVNPIWMFIKFSMQSVLFTKMEIECNI